MKILILSQTQVEALLPMKECIAVMAEALAALANNAMLQPLRSMVKPDGAKGILGLMPAYRGGEAALYAVKSICVFPMNPALGKDAHQGLVMLFSGETGEPLALMNASAITEIRTAAASGVATERLARQEASELAIIGSGVQARSHLEAMACVRPLKRARLVSRNIEHARELAQAAQARYAFPIEVVESAEQAVRGADLIVTATNAAEPVLQRDWIAEGAHINAVGACFPSARELDSSTIAASSLFVDRRESAENEAGDYLIPLSEGAIAAEHIRAEVGEILIGKHPGRSSQDEITIFKSLGLAVEDLAAAEYVYQQAQIQNLGTWVEFG